MRNIGVDKRKSVLYLIMACVLFLLLELSLKVYFILPSPFPKMIDMLVACKTPWKSQRTSSIVKFNWVEWDKNLNYKLRKQLHMEEFYRWPLIKDKFEVAINEDGFRYSPGEVLEKHGDFPQKKIICLGDSWTMGWGVDYTDSYPAQLQKILEQNFLGSKFSVVNLGVITYTSFQGVGITKKN